MKRRRFVTRMVALSASLMTTCAWSEDAWPEFHGPQAAGVANNPNLPTTWGPSTNVEWKVDVPGVAWSSPIAWGDQIFITTAIPSKEPETPKKGLYFGGERKSQEYPYRWDVMSFSLGDGKVRWTTTVADEKPRIPIHLKNTYASETPVTDGRRIWAYFGAAGLFCLDLDGKIVWKKDLGAYRMRFGWGTASSPALDGDRLYIQNDNEDQSFVACFDKNTGKELWRKNRDELSSWATPFVWKTPTRTELVTCASKKVRSYDAASGELLWELGGMSSIAVPTPFAGHGLLYINSGYVMDQKRPLFAIRPDAKGDITLAKGETKNNSIAWSQKQGGAYMPSALLLGDLVYVLYDRGFFGCFDAKTGEEVYKKRLPYSDFTTSPWAYNGKIFCLNEDGVTVVIKAGRQFEVVGENKLDEMSMATPAIIGDSLLLRTAKRVYRIRDKQRKPAAN